MGASREGSVFKKSIFGRAPSRLQPFLDSLDCFAVFIRHLGHCIELPDGFASRRAVRRRHLHSRIVFHHDLLRPLSASRFDFDGVLAGLDEWAARPKIESGCGSLKLFGRWHCRRIPPQIPARAVYPSLARSIEFPHQLAVLVVHADLRLALFVSSIWSFWFLIGRRGFLLFLLFLFACVGFFLLFGVLAFVVVGRLWRLGRQSFL